MQFVFPAFMVNRLTRWKVGHETYYADDDPDRKWKSQIFFSKLSFSKLNIKCVKTAVFVTSCKQFYAIRHRNEK